MGRKVSVWVSVLIFTMILPFFAKEQDKSRPPLKPLTEILNRDGTLNLRKGVEGSFDPSGFRMISKPGEAPRFLPAVSSREGKVSGGMALAPGDVNWDNQFGVPGLNGRVTALAAIGGVLYVGGAFTKAGDVEANHIAKWDGTSWSAMGSGMDGEVWALVTIGTTLYAGGAFSHAGGVNTGPVAKWGGTNWVDIREGFYPHLAGVVWTLAVMGNTLYAGGSFLGSFNRIAKWDGTSWSALGSGMDSDVFALATIGTTLYAGGRFNSAGGVPGTSAIAKWDGTSWAPISGEIHPIEVRALVAIDGVLYVGGLYLSRILGENVNVGIWDGTNWSPLGSGMNERVCALAVIGSTVYAGGWFNQVGVEAASYIAKWDGTNWLPLGSGMDGEVWKLCAFGSDLFAGGEFTTAGGTQSNYIGCWHGGVFNDPVLTWNTFLGGADGDEGRGIATNADGDTYVTGTSNVTWGSPVRPFTAGWPDAFVAKLDGGGNLLWSTFLGGAGVDNGQGIAVDTSGNVYAVGSSKLTWGSPVRPFSGVGVFNAFVAKLDGNGNLLWNTFLGAPINGAEGYGIAIDASGNTYVSGYCSYSWGSPVRAISLGGDGFVAKLDRNGNLLWNTFLGGSGLDDCQGIVVDSSGNICVTGNSMATWGLPVRPFSGSLRDAFVAKLDGAGNLLWNTFLGGSGFDIGYGVACDTSGNVYATGGSGGTWGSPVRPFSGAGAYDAVVAKLDGGGNLLWSTFLGGADEDYGYGIVVDTGGNAYIIGYSAATWGSPIKPFAGSVDGLVAKLDANGNLLWNTFFGGAGDDFGYALAVDRIGNVYGTGLSRATWGSPVRAYTGLGDALVAKIGLASSVIIRSPSSGAIVSGIVPIQIDAYDQSGISNVEIFIDGVLKATDTTYPYAYSWNTSGLVGAHTIKARAHSLTNQSGEAQISVSVSNALPPTITIHPLSQTISSGQTAFLSVEALGSAPLSYQWYRGATGNTSNPISGATSSSYTTPSLTSSASYWVRVSNALGNASSNTAVITIGQSSKMVGNIYDNATKVAISGAAVRLGAYPQVTTDANGHYELPNLSPGDYSLVISKAGYNTFTSTVGISISDTLTRNFFLTQTGGGIITIDSLTSKYAGFVYYLDGVDFVVTYTAHINWGGHAPGKARFITPNGQYEVTASGDAVSRDFNIATDFRTCTTLKAVAISSDNTQSQIATANFTVMPAFLSSSIFNKFDRGDSFYYESKWSELELINEELTDDVVPEDIPLFGKKGFNLNTLLSVNVTADSSGQVDFELDLTKDLLAQKEWAKGRMAGFEFSLTPKLHLSGQYSYPECRFDLNGSYLDLSGNISIEKSWPFIFTAGPFPIPMYIKASFDLNIDFSLGIADINPIKPNGQFTLEPYARGSLGAGVDGLFAVEGWIGAGAVFSLQYPQIPHLSDATIYANAGVSAYALLFKWETELMRWDWDLNKSAAQASISNQAAPVVPKLVSRQYLNRPNPGRFIKVSSANLQPTAQNSSLPKVSSALLQSSVFPYSDLCLKSGGALLGLTWVQDDAARLANNRTVAVFSTYNGTAWSDPQKIGDDGTADFHPQNLVFNDGTAIAAWEDEKLILGDTATFNDMVSNLEISTSIYKPSSGTWQALQRLTDNTFLDRSPLISGRSPSNVMLTWISNESNDLRGSASAPNKLFYSIYNGTTWSSPQILAQVPYSILKYSLVYDGAKGCIVLSLDTDGNPQTVADHELYRLTYSSGVWGAMTKLTNDNLPDDNPSLALDPNGNVVLVWLKGNELSSSMNFFDRTVIFAEEFSTNLADFKLTSTGGGKLAVVWAEPSDYNSDLKAIFYEPAFQSWGADPKQITFDPEVEKNIAIAFLGENDLIAAYDRTPVNTTSASRKAANGKSVTYDFPQLGVTDIYILQYSMGRDLALKASSLMASPPNPEPGAGVTLTVTVMNVGDETASSVPVAYYLGDPANGGSKIGQLPFPGNLKPGDTADLAFMWEVPATSVPLRIYAVVDPDGNFDTQNRGNNAVNIEIVKPDLSINGVKWDWLGADKISITARILNSGVISSTSTSVRFRQNTSSGALIGEQAIPAMSKGESRDVTIEWDTSGLSLQAYPVYISVDEDNLVPEFDENNNWKLVTITPAAVVNSILVFSPNGGESWPAGSVQNIQWATSGIVGNIKIEYSSDGGGSFKEIIGSSMNSGTYEWTVSNTPSTTCLVKVSETSNGAVYDVSDAVFTITPPLIVKDDLLGTWTGQGVYYRNSETGAWIILGSPANLVACGDLDGDGIDDLIGIWPGQGGVWVKSSRTGAWSLLSSTARDIAAGDMNGDGRKDLVGTWDGQGVFYRDSVSGTWVQMASPADQVKAGDLDGDGIADLIGIWPGQGGVWSKSSIAGAWALLSSTARDIAAGDMNGDGRVDLVGTWDDQGVFYRDSVSGTWVQMASPADLITTGDLDGDGTDDLIGIWSGQGGVWVKYSKTQTWAYLGSTALDIAAGKMAGGLWTSALNKMLKLQGPQGGYPEGPAGAARYKNLSADGPRGSLFFYQKGKNLIPNAAQPEVTRVPGPGEPGFSPIQQKNLVPHLAPKEKPGKDLQKKK